MLHTNIYTESNKKLIPLSIAFNYSSNYKFLVQLHIKVYIFFTMSRFLIKSQSVLLIILCDVFMYAHLSLIRSFEATNYAEVNNQIRNIIFDIGYCLIFFLFPLFCLLADIK